MCYKLKSLVVLAGQGAHLKTFHIPLLLIFPKQPAPFLRQKLKFYTKTQIIQHNSFLEEFFFRRFYADISLGRGWTRPILTPPFCSLSDFFWLIGRSPMYYSYTLQIYEQPINSKRYYVHGQVIQ